LSPTIFFSASELINNDDTILQMIEVLTTGGTIEGIDIDVKSHRKGHHKNLVEYFLSLQNLTQDYIIKKVFSKDSREITEDDKQLLAASIKNSLSQKILITHGTFTMIDTARFIARLSLGKTVILTGSFILGNKPETDAPKNIEFAIKKLFEKDKGVYIAMNNTLFNWDNVKKNLEKNRFETLSEDTIP